MTRKDPVRDVVGGIILVLILLYAFVIAPMIKWMKEHWILGILIGIVILAILIVIAYFVYQWRKADTEEFGKKIELERGILRKKILSERANELEGLTDEEKEYQVNKWIEEEQSKRFEKAGEPTKIRVPVKNSLQKAIFRAYDGRCALCHRLESLEIHHMDDNPSNNDPRNLIALCGTCHKKAESLNKNQLKSAWRQPRYLT